ncbi:eukaryotic translation initiation factor 4 gamma 1-like [Chanos chanos]|uniref:Eukaryotic translation initiation factor 4 gamma 1-like n=1 Tax=Chanos chanos TaxID=29144 RepID=A0A6J2VIA3_CHACN|nr:eukaryotic translation initiation factor 4 gamma 1-like [Chanos chanos]
MKLQAPKSSPALPFLPSHLVITWDTAGIGVYLDHNEFSCSICLDPLKDPVTVPCGHNYCMECIKGYWDQDDQRRVYHCPQCREAFSPRPVLKKNTLIAEMFERLKKTGFKALPAAQNPKYVKCDLCTTQKQEAIKSCLQCVASYCDTHIQPHYESAGFMEHKLVKASMENFCTDHGRWLDVYCTDDQQCICYLCMTDRHKGHHTILAESEWTSKQVELKDKQSTYQQQLKEREKQVQELNQVVTSLKFLAQVAVRDSERIFNEMIQFIEKKRSEVAEVIRSREKAELSRAEETLAQLEREIAELKKRDAQIEKLSQTENMFQFLQGFQPLCKPLQLENLRETAASPVLSFGHVPKSVLELKERLEKLCGQEMKRISENEQWKPLNPEARKKYDREFLLGFQFISASMHKPEGLPHISDVVLDKAASIGSPRQFGQGQRKEPHEILPPVSQNDDVQLNKSENAWKPSVRQGRAGEEEDAEAAKTQKIFRRVRSVLNRLMPQTFQPLMKQVTELTIDTEERLKGVIDLIFEKAISEPNFSVAYANMCRCLMGLKVPTADKPGATVNFRKLLLNRCQKEFEKDKDDDETFEKKQQELDAASGEEERQRLMEELEEAKDKARRRSLGSIKFIGELFKLKILTEPIMHDCIVKLLKNHDEKSLECLCRLLSTIGKDLDFEKAKPRMDQYFNQMEKIIKERKTSSRIRFMLQDVLDLRRCNWVPRHTDPGPKITEQVHKELQEHRRQINVQRQLLSKKQSQGGMRGGGGGGPRPNGGGQEPDEGWNTVLISKNRPIDTTCLSKITKPGALDFNNQLLAPGGKGTWGSWGKGSSGGPGGGGEGGPRPNGGGQGPDEGWNTVPISKNRPIDTTRLSKITKFRIRDPNQGGRDITEEIMSDGRSVSTSTPPQFRIRDPNQGGRDITEEIMSDGRSVSTSTPPQFRIRDPNQGGRDITEEIMSDGRSVSTSTPPQFRIRDPNQGGRDITEEMMSDGRSVSTSTPPQFRIRDPNQGGRDITEEIMSDGRSVSTSTPPQLRVRDPNQGGRDMTEEIIRQSR